MKVIRKNGHIIEYHSFGDVLIVVERMSNGLRSPIDTVVRDPQFFSGHGEDMTGGVEEPHPWPVVCREEAKAAKDSKYYTGKPCKQNHISQRYVSSGLCIACVAERARRFNKSALPGGLVRVEFDVHPDDIETVRALVGNINKARSKAL